MNRLFVSLLLLFLFNTPIMSQNLVKMEIVPPTSPESPFYNGNVSFSEMIQAAIEQSDYRANYFASVHNLPNGNSSLFSKTVNGLPNPPVSPHLSGLYAVKVGVGPRVKMYYLTLDTGSNLIWMQCHECLKRPNQCFPQLGEPPYNCNESPTCSPLDCKQHPLSCLEKDHCRGGRCRYQFQYHDGSHTNGYLAMESFTLDVIHGNTFALYFGCGINQQSFYHGRSPRNMLAGVMGMSMGKHSLPVQLRSRGVVRWFSHCLHPIKQTYLAFGLDVPQLYGYQQTRLKISGGKYWVEVNEIVVSGQRSKLQAEHWALTDTGTPFTRLFTEVYTWLTSTLTNLFSQDTNLRQSFNNGDTLCYKRITPTHPYNNLPTITFLLGRERAELIILPEDAFYFDHQNYVFCLAMKPHDGITILGTRALTHQTIIYDHEPTTKNNMLYFKQDAC